MNKFIRDKISTLEKKLPFEEAKTHEENIRQAEATDYDDTTFNLLFKDELQEREVARILLEYGIRKWDDQKLVADYLFEEMVDESLIDNADIIRLLAAFKEALQTNPDTVNRNFFIYHPDTKLSTLAVSLLNFPMKKATTGGRNSASPPAFNRIFSNNRMKILYGLSLPATKKS